MTLKKFITINRDKIDRIVKEYYGEIPSNDNERKEWILSDRGLYEWAQQEGINV